jgi:membrane protein involved in colicin uptake
MKSRIHLPLSLSLLALTHLGASAQNAADFFHGGAQSYLSNNIPVALEVVTNGLQRFPDDEKLQKLYELLNQQQQQQQQQQEQKEQDQNEEQKQEQQQQDEQKNSEQPKEDQSQKPEQKKPEEQKSGGDQSKPQPEEKEQSGEPQQASPQTMTPQEAKQLLDAQKNDEQVLIFQPQTEPKNRARPLKDW